MLTERTNLANLVTIVHNSRPAGKTEATARDSFESFVAKGGIQFQQQNKGTNQDLGVERRTMPMKPESCVPIILQKRRNLKLGKRLESRERKKIWQN